MKYRAVVFDLFGTLVDNTSFVGNPSEEWRRQQDEMAAAVGAEAEAFRRVWDLLLQPRMTGVFPTVEACVEHVCDLLQLPVRGEQIRAAAAIRIEYMRTWLVPRPDAVATLAGLKAAGYRIGLISNCIPDVPLLWDGTALAAHVDAPIFSSAVGLAKPDPRIYRLACERLGVAPEQSLFVADGEGGELAGAAAVGMTPVLIRCSYEDPPDVRRPHVEPWEGPSICWLEEITAFLR